MPQKKRAHLPYKPKSRGDCAYSKCGRPVYKAAARYQNKIWHPVCLVKAVREGEV